MEVDASLLRDSLARICPPEEELDDDTYFRARRSDFGHIFFGRLRAKSHAFDAFYEERQIDPEKQIVVMFTRLWNFVHAVECADPYLVDRIRLVGSVHRDYGVSAWMYPMIGATLLETFEEFLGVAWTDDMKEQWNAAFACIMRAICSAHEP